MKWLDTLARAAPRLAPVALLLVLLLDRLTAGALLPAACRGPLLDLLLRPSGW